MLGSAHGFLVRSSRVTLCATVLGMMCAPALRSELVYFTAFENPPFLVGPDNWVGTDGWTGNSIGDGVHGIDDDFFVDNDQTAFLGFEQPSVPFVTVANPLHYDPAVEGTVRIQLDTLLGIEDSENGFRDSFFLSIFNSGGHFLAGIRFDNTLATYGIWRHNGVNEFDTGFAFIHGELHLFCLEIDFANNRWKGDMDGIPIFPSVPFTATGQQRNLGFYGYEWQLTDTTRDADTRELTNYGDNWMLIADSIVWAIPPGEQNFIIDQISFDTSGQPVLEWTFEPGWTYQIEYTDNLSQWLTDLPGSTFEGAKSKTQQSFVDPTSRPPNERFYRITRSVTP